MSWGPGAAGGFQNALATGLQLGQMARARQDQKDQRNALSAFVTNPNAETAAGVAPFNPELAYQYGQDVRAQEVKQQEQRGLDRQTYRKLLGAARDNPQQAVSAARQMGLDLTGLPEVGTPQFNQWLETEMFVLDELEDPEKLTSIQNDLQSFGIDPNTPEGRKAASELVLFKYGKQGTDELGRPVLVLPTITLPDPRRQGQAEVQEGTVIRNQQTGERMVRENGEWVPISETGARRLTDEQMQKVQGL